MKDMYMHIDQANSIKIINPQTIKIEKLEFRWLITINDTVEFTIESADLLPDWVINNYDRPIGWNRMVAVTEEGPNS